MPKVISSKKIELQMKSHTRKLEEFSAWGRLKRNDGQMWYPEWDAGTEKGDYRDK